MPTGTRPQPDEFDLVLAALVRSRMAGQTPAMTATDLAGRTGIPRATLSKLVRGQSPMTLAHIRRIAVALGTSHDKLTGRAQRIVDGLETIEGEPGPSAGEHRAG